MSEMTFEQQSEHLDTLYEMWQKTVRVCGYGSKPELAMFEVLTEETENFYNKIWEAIE